jgi:hypothetical protein
MSRGTVSPYRETSEAKLAAMERLAPERTWWRRAMCWLIGLSPFRRQWLSGHAWRITRTNAARHDMMQHLHWIAGCDAVCMRCGAVWEDYEWTIAEPTLGRVLREGWSKNEEATAARLRPTLGAILKQQMETLQRDAWERDAERAGIDLRPEPPPLRVPGPGRERLG